jgi:hypothetical protein
VKWPEGEWPTREELHALRDGWNGEGTIAPKPQTIKNFESVLHRLPEDDTAYIQPNENGTISVSAKSAELEIGLTRYAGYVKGAKGSPNQFFNGEFPGFPHLLWRRAHGKRML